MSWVCLKIYLDLSTHILLSVSNVEHILCPDESPFFLTIYRAPASSASQPCYSSIVIRNENSQNADFPRNYSKREKKPFPIPVLELRRRARQRMKEAEGKPKRPPPPPKNGMLVQRLIPEAYTVYNARILLINNLKRLMKVVPVKGCK